MRSLFDRALRESKKPRGGYKMALFGAETRHRLINLIDEVEAEIGQCAFAIAEDTGAMEINPSGLGKRPIVAFLNRLSILLSPHLPLSAALTRNGHTRLESIVVSGTPENCFGKRALYWFRLLLTILMSQPQLTREFEKTLLISATSRKRR
jgi:hypothetical protein